MCSEFVIRIAAQLFGLRTKEHSRSGSLSIRSFVEIPHVGCQTSRTSYHAPRYIDVVLDALNMTSV